MKQDTWFKSGIESLEKEKWFDGIQLIQGALERSFRKNDYENVENIMIKSAEILILADRLDLYCQLALSNILPIAERGKDEEWFLLIPTIYGVLVKVKSESCLVKIRTKIIETKSFQEKIILEHLKKIISKEKVEVAVQAELFFLLASLEVSMQLFPECFDTLVEWKSLSPTPSPEILAYLTLAELNAFEIDGCGQYLKEANELNSQSEYIELTSQLFKAVELKDYELCLTIIEDYQDILTPVKDILLVRLTEGISDFMKPKEKKNLFSLFGGR